MPGVLHSGFLEGPSGPLHLSLFSPPEGVTRSRWVLHAPAFAEEMNKCRPMVARQARRLAEEGAVVVVPDLFGTGDSAGDFSQADWSRWLADLRFLRRWCLEQGAGDICLWGVRLGCLLALESAAQDREALGGMLLWQPVLAGALHLNQFLRLRAASGMMQGEAETVSDLRRRLDDGETLEVAGYSLSQQLYRSIAAAAASSLGVPPGNCPVLVCEVAAGPDKPLLPATAKQVRSWSESNSLCRGAVVEGSPFWLTQEIGFAPTLLNAGVDFLRSLAQPSVTQGDPAAGLLPDMPTPGGGTVKSLVFACAGEQLAGQLHRPAQHLQEQGGDTGVLIVVGGPQYRVGSHRQFQQLAEYLGAAGVPVLRFDYRGMGDSSGELRGYTAIVEDIRCAVDVFVEASPQVKRLVLWGLCDAATASVFYAHQDPRVSAMVLANPWVYSEQGEAKTYLKHYYRERLLSPGLWRKILRGDFDWRASLASLCGFLRRALGAGADRQAGSEAGVTAADADAGVGVEADLVSSFTRGLELFGGNTLFIISDNDLTAAEFMDAARDHAPLRKRMHAEGNTTLELTGADHTFSRRAVCDEVEAATLAFVQNLPR